MASDLKVLTLSLRLSLQNIILHALAYSVLKPTEANHLQYPEVPKLDTLLVSVEGSVHMSNLANLCSY